MTRHGYYVHHNGYLARKKNGKTIYGHRAVWEAAHGPIPEGMELHHINGDRQDNRLENLELLTAQDHQRTHSPYFVRIDGAWHRRCRTCLIVKPLTEYHSDGKDNTRSQCAACRNTEVKAQRKGSRFQTAPLSV